jgi:hypothetical protein
VQLETVNYAALAFVAVRTDSKYLEYVKFPTCNYHRLARIAVAASATHLGYVQFGYMLPEYYYKLAARSVRKIPITLR